MNHTRSTRRHLLLLIGIELFLFSPCLPSGYFLDDFIIVETAHKAPLTLAGLARSFDLSARQIHDGWKPSGPAGGNVTYFRPLFVAGLKLDEATGLGPWVSHLHNILLHALTTAIAYLLFLELFPMRATTALLLSLLFGLHPQNLYTVAWISARTEIISGFFLLLGLVAFLRYRQHRRTGAYLLSLACMVLALLGKENGLIFPLIAFAADFLIAPQHRVKLRYHAPFLGLAALYLAIRTLTLGGFPTPPPGFIYHPISAPDFVPFALTKTICNLGGLFFLGPSFWLFQSWLESHPVVLIAYAAAVVAGTGWIFWSVRSRVAVFLGLWIASALAPSLPLLASSHYYYFAVPPALALYALFADRFTSRDTHSLRWMWFRRGVWVLSAIFAVSTIFLSWLINPFFRSGQRPAEEIVAAVPDPPHDARLYFIDLPLAGVYITPYLRMLYGRDDIQGHILSLAPDLAKPADSRLEWTDPQTLRLTSLNQPYFTDVVTRRIVSMQGGISEGARGSAGEYDIVIERVEIGPDGAAGVRSFRYEFHAPIAGKPRLFFAFTKEGVRRLSPP